MPLQMALERLAEADILLVQGLPPESDYRFKHALIQEAAYENLLKSRRQVLHRRVAELLRDDPTAAAQPELLAHHFSHAGLAEVAIEWWGKAGERSLERSALVEAVEQLTRALDLIASLPSTAALRREEIRLQVALITPLIHVKGYAAPETKAAEERARLLIEQAEALGQPLEEPLLLFSVLYRLLGRELCCVQRRRHAQSFGAVLDAGHKAKGDRPARDWASAHGHFLAAYRGHCGWPSPLRSGDCALRT